MLTFDPMKIRPEHLPEISRAAASPDFPTERRLLLARAAVPMDPVDVVATVAFLIDDASEIVSKAARDTIRNMPLGVLNEAIRLCQTPEILDSIARNLGKDRAELLETVVQNKASADETVAWIAAHQEGHIVDIIAKNQMRVQRCGKIVEAIYFNPNARMGLVLNLLEDAVRLGVDISMIPGWEEIVESIHGKEAVMKAKGIVTQAAQAAKDAAYEAAEAALLADQEPLPEIELEPGEEPPPVFEVDDAAVAGDAAGQPDDDAAPGVDDETFQQILKEHAGDKEAEEEGPLGGSLLNDLAKMSVPQKVRLALLGSESVRRELIRDTRRIVYMSVMKSPRLSDKEVGDFAKNKALNEEIIRTIAMNREWTSTYAVKMALIANPKCPAPIATQFLRMLQPKDVKGLARSHDVPGYVARAAKQLLAAWEMGKRH